MLGSENGEFAVARCSIVARLVRCRALEIGQGGHVRKQSVDRMLGREI